MREKILAIAARLHRQADHLRDNFPATSRQFEGSHKETARLVLHMIARVIEKELKAPGGEDSGVAPRSTDEPMEAVLEPIDWPCRLEDLRPGPAIIVATPPEKGRLIFKSDYTENLKIIAYNEDGDALRLDEGTIVQAVYLTWRER